MHTIAHIHEMKAEIKDGLEFMQRSETHWKVRSCPRVICLENSVYPLELSRGFMDCSFRVQLTSGKTRVLLREVSVNPQYPLGATWLPQTCQCLAGDSRIGFGLGHLV